MSIIKIHLRSLSVLCLSAALAAIAGKTAIAQIIPDTTLGSEASVTSDVTVQGAAAELIEGGATRGVSLFHSFAEFNVAELQRVYFANPAGIENILSRITGSNPSNILGTLGVDGSANLFLLNPNGIVFGPNAQLDIAGSFLASTAEAFNFNGQLFSAADPTVPVLLTVSLTPGLQYSAVQRSEIRSEANLAVGHDLGLAATNLDLSGQLSAGGDLTLQAQDTVQIRDSAASPFVAAAGRELRVQGNAGVDIFALAHADSGLFAGSELILRSAAPVIGDAYFWSGGSFRVEQLDGSFNSLLSPNDPVITAGGNVAFTSYTGGSLRVLAGGSVDIGSVTLAGSDPGFPDQAVPLSRPLPDGTSTVLVNGSVRPVVDIRAGTLATSGPLSCAGCPPFPANLTAPGTALSADIAIDSITISEPNGLVLLSNQFQPNTTLTGDIQVQSVRVDDRASSLFGFFGRFTGNGGDVFIDSRGDITLPGGGFFRPAGLIQTSSTSGRAGDVGLIAAGQVALGNGARIEARTGGSNRAGNISVLADSLELLAGAQLDVNTEATGNAGDITIQTQNQVFLSGTETRIQSVVDEDATADAGNINIQAGSLTVERGAEIHSLIAGNGNGGDIDLDIQDAVIIDGGGRGNENSAISTSLTSTGQGNGGSINLRSSALSLTNGGMLIAAALVSSARGAAQGNTGNINIDVSGAVVIEGRAPTARFGFSQSFPVFSQVSVLSSSAGGVGGIDSAGDAGNINIQAGSLRVSDGASLETTSYSSLGSAGNLSIAVDSNIEVSNNAVVAAVVERGRGSAGAIDIQARNLAVTDSSRVLTSSAGSGDAGRLAISVSENINLANSSRIAADTLGNGQGGEMLVLADKLTVSDRSELGNIAAGTGNGGDVSVNVRDTLLVEGASGVTSLTLGEGAAGDLTLEARRLIIQDDSIVNSSTLGAQPAGDILARTSESIEVLDGGQFSSDTFGTGRGGTFNIETRQLRIEDSEISAATIGNGPGGTLNVTAFDSVDLAGGSIATVTLGAQPAGNVNLTTSRLTGQRGGSIEAGTAGQGRGGDITVLATESIDFSGTSEPITFETVLKGLEGNPLLNVVFNQGQLDPSELPVRPGLTLIVNDPTVAGVLPSGISTFGQVTSSGASGNISVTTGAFTVRDGAQISTAALGNGNGGSIEVQASSLELSNTGRVISRSQGQGFAGNVGLDISRSLTASGGEISASSDLAGGGNVDISANVFFLNRGSLVSSSVFDSTGGGGNIDISSRAFVAIEDSDILANAELGAGGNIFLNSPAFLADLFSSSQATPVGRNPGSFSQFRGNGRVDISVDSAAGTTGGLSLPELVTDEGLTELPVNLVDPTGLIDRRCQSLGRSRSNEFVVTGQGGLPSDPSQRLEEEGFLEDLGPEVGQVGQTAPVPEAAPEAITSPERVVENPERIVEPQSWIRDQSGEIRLVAAVPDAADAPELIEPTCRAAEEDVR
ncbi:MAG: filamentous hemagglutinin N-terminal domain-containing protein [Leptolyngbyaceae cyanobacterium SL_1_1]|nr:filamentous hemagglutinin N-terminal domain-containing protein [Leptolyngbyaceae cyanobacterium SL_1_1]